MEKQGIIKKGITPPEGNKKNLEDHVTKRAADALIRPNKTDKTKQPRK